MPPSLDDLAIVRRINVFRGLNPRMIEQMVAPATTLSRAFAKLRSVGVHVHAAHVEVRNLDKLRRFAADDRGSARSSLRRPRSPGL